MHAVCQLAVVAKVNKHMLTAMTLGGIWYTCMLRIGNPRAIIY